MLSHCVKQPIDSVNINKGKINCYWVEKYMGDLFVSYQDTEYTPETYHASDFIRLLYHCQELLLLRYAEGSAA